MLTKTELRPEQDTNGLHQIRIRVIHKRAVIRIPIKIKVKPENFDNGVIVNMGKQTNAYNTAIRTKVNEVESIILKNLDATPTKLKELLFNKQSSLSVRNFVDKLMDDNKGKLSNGRLKHYDSVCNKIEKHQKNVLLTDINDEWMTKFEKHLREKGNGQNTINTNMKIIIAILHNAEKRGLIKYPLKSYKKPSYVQNIPEYLTEEEIEAFKKAVEGVSNITIRTAGYYFLLGCYTGLRISDLQTFNQKERVKNGNIVIRAKKNGQIVSIPVYPKLQEVLTAIKDLKFDMAEQTMRKYVKDIAKMAGITRKIKVHSSRHSHAMLLMKYGFSVEEVAEILGDSVNVAKVYARVTNKQLSDKIIRVLGE